MKSTGALLNRLFTVGVQRRQARAHRDRPRRGGRLGQLRGGRARAKDLRRPRGPQRPGPRRRRDGQADRRAPEAQGVAAIDDRQPDARVRAQRLADAIGKGRAAPWTTLASALEQRRHRHHRDRRGRADPDQGARRGGDAAAAQPAAVHHRHRRAARRRARRPARSSRCSSTTSTICRRPCARTWRGAPARSSAPKRSSARRSSGSRRGCSRARSFPTVVALRQRFEAIRRAELERLESKLAALPPEARARVDEITHLIVEKLLLTPTEQLKALDDEAAGGRLHRRADRLFKLSAPSNIGPPTLPTPAPARRPELARPLNDAACASARAAASSRCGRRETVAAARRPRARRRRARHASRPPAIGCRRRRSPGRRQGAVRQGNRGRAAGRRDRPRRPQQQGHVGDAARRA